jgi:hypothetical protein
MPGNDFVDNGNDIEVVIQKGSDPECTELFGFKLEFTYGSVLPVFI